MEIIRGLFGHPAFLVLTVIALPVLTYLLISKMMKTESSKECGASETEFMSSKNLVTFLPLGIIAFLLLLFFILNLDEKNLFSPFTPERLEPKTRIIIFLLPVILLILLKISTFLINIFLTKNDKKSNGNALRVIGEVLHRLSLFLLFAIFVVFVLLLISH